MNDLPTPASDAGTINNQQSTIKSGAGNDSIASQPPPASGTFSKEAEVVTPPVETSVITEVGQEAELPREVAAVGVRVQPTAVAVPPKVSQLGVKPSGPNVPLGTGATIVLPLTKEKISQGLHQSVAHSFRWLAEWCKRKLKQIHSRLKGTTR